LRSTTRSLAVTASLLLVLATSGVAAGATQNASPKQWVSTFCGSVLTWEQTVTSNSAKLKKTVAALQGAGKVDLTVLKGQLVGFLDGIVKSTSTMVGKIKAVGAPAVKNGSKIQKVVLDAFGQVATGFNGAKTSAQALPTNDRSKFAKGAFAIASSIKATSGRGQSALLALNKYPTKALDDAANKDPSCTKLGG
jgi:hypothetical protein